MTPSKTSAGDLSIDPYERHMLLRGDRYDFTEIAIGEYDDIIKKVTSTKTRDDGEEMEIRDTTLQLRLLVLASTRLNGKALTAPVLAGLKAPVAFKVNAVVNRMYFDELPEDKPSEDAEEGEGKGEG